MNKPINTVKMIAIKARASRIAGDRDAAIATAAFARAVEAASSEAFSRMLDAGLSEQLASSISKAVQDAVLAGWIGKDAA